MARDSKMDVQLDVPSGGYGGRLEVIEGPTRPTAAHRRGEGADCGGEPDARCPGSGVARKYGVTRWQVYDWRKRLRHGHLALPENIATAAAFAALLVEEPSQPRQVSVGIDIIIGDIVVRAGQDADDGICRG